VSATSWLRVKARAGRVLLAGLALCAVAGVFWYRRLSTGEQYPAPAGLPENDTRAEMVSRDFRHVETRMDRTIWILESARAEMFDDRASLYSVKVTWFGEPGEITVVITSAAGTVDFKKRHAELRGKVRFERADGVVLLTEIVLWDDTTKMMQAPQPVVITTPNFTFHGDSLDANLSDERITLRGRVRGEIRSGSLVKSRPS